MLDEHFAINEFFSASPNTLFEHIEHVRLNAARRQDKGRRAELGQFFTPLPVARFLASLLQARTPHLRILDAGAGTGSLFAACVAELCGRSVRPDSINITAYEIDETLRDDLQETLRLCQAECERAGITFEGSILQDDFIEAGSELLQGTLFSPALMRPSYNCAILNPPYKKIQTQSRERKLLRKAGIESSNLYAGFLALAMQLLEPAGELIAITPRSFCNGPYFKDFREKFLQTMALKRLHVFNSRKQTFREEDVLQENIILHAVFNYSLRDTEK